MISVLLLGSGGQLGLSFIKSAPKNIYLTYKSKNNLNIFNFNDIENLIIEIKPDVVINCAAYTKVDLAEDNISEATNININAVKFLAEISNKYNYLLVHFSTDYVYDGKSKILYNEFENRNPLSIYGTTKNEGDLKIVKYSARYLIFRVSWLFGPENINFLTKIVELLNKKKFINIIDDQFSIPTHSYDLSKYIWKVITENSFNTLSSNIFNFSNSGDVVSWYDFAKKIQNLYIKYYKSNTVIKRISTLEYNQKAERPFFSALDSSKVDKIFKINRNNWEDSLAKSIDAMMRKNLT